MLRNWELTLVLDRAPQAAPLGVQLVRALIDDMRDGRLAPGTVLPGTRVLAERLGVSRKTVVHAFDELISQRWIVTEPQRGSFVAFSLPATDRRSADADEPDRVPALAADAAIALRGAPRRLAYSPAPDGAITLDDGLPDGRRLPTALLARAIGKALAASAAANTLGYGDPRGDVGLRSAIAAMLRVERGVPADADNICITRGSQMAIHLALRLFAGPGDTVALERLGYGPVSETARAIGAEAAGVALDEHGMDLDSLEALCRRKRVRVVYITPHHQYPTTVPMRPERRMRLLTLAAQFGFVVLEDDYDHEFHFEGRPLLPVIGADRQGRVVYVGSFSKLLSPSLRLGYIAGPPSFIERAAGEIMLLDRMGDPVLERAVAMLMQEGAVRSHARRALRVYAERRLHAASCLNACCGDWLAFDLPAGGLAIWARPPAWLDPARLREAASAEGLVLLPGAMFTVDGAEAPGLRIGFASLEKGEFADAVGRLDRAGRRCLAGFPLRRRSSGPG